MAYATDYTTLLTGSNWTGIEVTGQPAFVTYSFDATAPASDAANLAPSAYATFKPFTAQQQTEAQQALGEWSNASGLVFLQVAPGKGDINFASYDFSSDPNAAGAGGMGFYPFGNWDFATYPYFATDNPGSGNVLMNTADTTGGLFAYATMLHETGHALGLKHPDEAWTDYAAGGVVHNQWNPSTPLPTTRTVMNEGPTSLTHLGPMDINAIRAIYGGPSQQGAKDLSWSWGDSTDTLTQHLRNTGTLEVRGISTSNTIFGGSGVDTIEAMGAGTNKVYAGAGGGTIVGGSGNNTLLAFSGADTFIGTFGPTLVTYARATTSETIDLAAPWLNTGLATGDAYIDVHTVTAGNHGDTLIGDDAGDTLRGGSGNDIVTGGTGADTLLGLAGNDFITGGGGADKLTGGAGADTFAYTALTDSTVAVAGRDQIYDFSSAQGDKIDLSGIAASTGTPLSFIGSAPFDGTAGEVRVTPGANTLVTLDDTGSKTPDFAILLLGSHTLTVSDFILTGGGAPAAMLSVADQSMAGGASANDLTTSNSTPMIPTDHSGEGGNW